ncbi:2-oxoglutarate-dependent dioxygenase DAO-like [Silene latifolia]|uniref:2-oxoglutarate-dependent dioxygenase DAO-like n=1 Tax=Silene latifolia TaxID=37657 RepID=UPI003D76CD42
METQIPVIDLQEPQKLREVCSKWGCFRLINHGVDTKLMAEMKSAIKELFDRPLEIKQRNKEVIAGGGYVAPSEKNPLYEAFGLFDVASPLSVSSFCSDLQASPHTREIIEKYGQAISKLAIEIASKLATSMGLKDYSFEDWPLQFRINKYTFTRETLGSSGVQIHTDSGFLTILQDDENLGGLEVMNPSGIFTAVDPLPDTFLVNLGDIAVPWSNGELRNVQHRVQCKDVGIRLSVATFLSPSLEQTIEAHPSFIKPGHPPIYAPFTYEQLRGIRAAEKLHAGEALDRVRLSK